MPVIASAADRLPRLSRRRIELRRADACRNANQRTGSARRRLPRHREQGRGGGCRRARRSRCGSLLVLLLAWIVARIVTRVIRRMVERVRDDGSLSVLRRRVTGHGRRPRRDAAPRAAGRDDQLGAAQRRRRSIIWTIAVLIVLGELGVDLAPLIAGAGIAGVALGFGAQTIVRDYLAGLFVVLEDQYGVGDVIDAGAATGTVEWVSLRLTRLRDADGVVWYVPNGEIKRVGNFSQRRDVGGGEPPDDDDPADDDPAR